MNQINLLRTAVETRKKHLIRLLEQHHVTKESGKLDQWTLSELENEWKSYLELQKKDTG
ncbi:Fur-regulated basic protein FbpA [Sporolactobacillus sp. Y61]|uniref:Fur-regulated basic protein FbpA n=1 Tax=Sporolactobacillus sp. Y61 TaxID=3160863 RepID=A0AAU8IEW2_9BACL|nr:Fur-regulated basic protein FbpA [Sporolactobacillus sp. THM19-2]RYL94540.1 Fur-regulated basic protein FbpA [Sporolactobacillus sp. THM19-2]